MTRRPVQFALWFIRAWDAHRWEMVLLAAPFTRATLFILDLAPAQLNDEVVAPREQMAALALLGFAALVAMFGVMREMPIVERTGLQMLGPFSSIYAIASLVSDPNRGSVVFTFYLMIGACCFARAREITKAMRIVNRRLQEAAAPQAGPR